jgi:hypothetical protein
VPSLDRSERPEQTVLRMAGREAITPTATLVEPLLSGLNRRIYHTYREDREPSPRVEAVKARHLNRRCQLMSLTRSLLLPHAQGGPFDDLHHQEGREYSIDKI